VITPFPASAIAARIAARAKAQSRREAQQYFTQPPMRRMRICFTDVFFVFFSVRHKKDNRSRERLNGFS